MTQKTSIIPKLVTEYDLRLLRVYKAVVEQGGFANAEAELGITRSTISVHMSALETRMNLKLCVRGRGGFALTEAGQAVYHGIISLFESLDDFSSLVHSLGHEVSGELVVLCADQLDAHKQKRLSKAIEYIHQLWPNLHLVLDGDSIHNIEKLLLKDKAHIGVFPNYQQVEGLSYAPLYSELMYLCCSKNHPLFTLCDDEITEEVLAETAAVHPGVDIDSEGRRQLKKLKLSAKAYQFDNRKTLICSGGYVGYLPKGYIESELANGELKIIKADSHSYSFNLSLVTKRHARENTKVELLKDAFAHGFDPQLTHT